MTNTNSLQYEIDLEEEICCEICMEVIHCHIEECPVCGVTSAGTSIYESISDCIYYNDGKFTCEECNSEFQIIDRHHNGEVGDILVRLVSTENNVSPSFCGAVTTNPL